MLSLTQMMVTVGKRKTSRELRATVVAMSNGYQPGRKKNSCCRFLWVGSMGGRGQWQFLKLKFGEFLRVEPEALGIMIGVGTVIIRGNGNVVVGESKAV